MLVYGTQIKSPDPSSAVFAFAGKSNNYSICFASKIGRANVFLTTLRKKSHPEWLSAPLSTEQRDNLAI